MTYADLLDVISFTSGDAGSGYRNKARTWLNLVRNHIAEEHWWKCALDPDVELTTAAATTTGIYTINSSYQYIFGDDLWDETNKERIQHESFADLNSIDALKEMTGPPTYWADAGTDTNGVQQIYLWPVPDGTYTVRYAAYRKLSDITNANDTDTKDDFFGPILNWSACFESGLWYYHHKFDNENVQTVLAARAAFEAEIKKKKAKNSISATQSMRLRSTRPFSSNAMGRFDPAHYSNRG